MLTHPAIDPVAVQIGPLAIHWYGLMYVVGIGGAWLLARRRAASGWVRLDPQQVDDLVFWVAFGLVVGGRMGYALFYGFDRVLDDPLSLVRVWEGGMSFHGGLLGALAGAAWSARILGMPFFALTDLGAPLVPIGLFAGRVGNFINGELWGRVTDLPWGMVFPSAGPAPRHPSQLYEALLEGVVLFAILNAPGLRGRPRGWATAFFLIGYGVFRLAIEFVREPDAHLGFLLGGWLTMGMLLTLPVLLLGLLLWSHCVRCAA